MPERRSGVLTFGSFITDHNLAIESYPPEDRTTFITSRHLAAGGPGYNIAANLRRLDPDMRVECHGLVGDDENGKVVLDALARHGISADGMTLTREAPQVYVEVLASQATGRRTFFFFRGTADLLDEDHVDPGASRARIFHVGAPGLHPRLDRPHPEGGNGWTRVLARARELGFRTNMEMASLDGDLLRPIVRPCLPLLDSIVINDLEGEAVTEIEIRPEGVLDWEAAGRACRRLREMGVRQVAAIHFPEGGGRGRCRRCPARTGCHTVARFAHRERGRCGGRLRSRARLRPARRVAGAARPRTRGLRGGGVPGKPRHQRNHRHLAGLRGGNRPLRLPRRPSLNAPAGEHEIRPAALQAGRLRPCPEYPARSYPSNCNAS